MGPICTGEKTLTRLHYLEAARYFQEAADLVPTGHPDEDHLAQLAWAGKRVHGRDEVDPLICRGTRGGRVVSAFVGSAVQGYAELWRAIAADANVPEPFDHAQGGEVGMVLRLARSPLEGRVGYRIDHAVLGGGTRLETVDGVVIGIGLSGR